MAARDLSPPWFDVIARDFASVREAARGGRWDQVVAELNRAAGARAIRNARDRPIVFVEAGAAGDAPYESHVWRTGEVPTRRGAPGGWHDLFNALVWLSFPRTKAKLNRLQAEAIAAGGVGPRRGGLRDAATLFDESGAVVVTRDAGIASAMRAMRWRELFVDRRAGFAGAARVLVFGHALFDKLRAPYKAICAQAWVIEDDPAAADVDRVLAECLDARTLRAGALAPLPILGVPGWWPENADPAFYEDPEVFRAARARHRRDSCQDPPSPIQ